MTAVAAGMSLPSAEELKALEWLRHVGIRRVLIPASLFQLLDEPAAESPPPADAFAAAFFPVSDGPFCLSSTTHSMDPSRAPDAALFQPPSPRPALPASSLHLLCADERSTTDRYAGDLTGLHVWPISAFLCSFLACHPSLLSGADVLEVGSGCGLVGLFAARSGARRSVLSDVSDNALRLCRLNAGLNGLHEKVGVAALPWADEAASLSLMADFPAGFPLIVGSDCMYKLSTLDALFESIDAVLLRTVTASSAPPLFLHAYQPRWDEVTSHLLTVARRYHFAFFIAVEATDLSTAAPEVMEEVRLHGIRLWRVKTTEQLLALHRPSIHVFVREDSGHSVHRRLPGIQYTSTV